MQLNEITYKNCFEALWQPHSWRSFTAAQQPEWGSSDALSAVSEQLARLPGLVGATEIESLKYQIADAGLGRRFILQGGDCAERFQDCREDVIRSKLQILMQMAIVMGYAAKRPIVTIGRMAGQYAKPRSEAEELTKDGRRIPIFRGESINGFEDNFQARTSDPLRLLQAYHSSSATLNFIRLLMGSGFGDLLQTEQWSPERVPSGAYGKRYEQIVHGLRDTLAFIASCSGSEVWARQKALGFKDFYVSHEALVLPYEESLTRFVPDMGRYYNLSTHMLWIGDRTRKIDGAHVEYCRGVGNPVGIKISAESNVAEIVEVIARVNPHNEVGKVNLITRLGAAFVSVKLRDLIRAVNVAGLTVTWSVDPMHGNTVRTPDGRKTRRFESIASEVQDSFEVHKASGSVLGGIHLEMTADDVTECTGGAAVISDSCLSRRYETWCDPRLNGAQSLELAFVAAACLRRGQDLH